MTSFGLVPSNRSTNISSHKRTRSRRVRRELTDQSLSGTAPSNSRRCIAKVQLPFWLLDPVRLESKLNLFDDDAVVWWVATGERPARPLPPHDPLTSWVALAYMGGIEEGGPGLEPRLDREARLRIASEVLGEDELLVVETLAIPHRYRCLGAETLEEIVRHAHSYVDRLWAACWLTLTGWTESRHCGFRDVCADFPMGELDELVYAAFVREQEVARGDSVGIVRIGKTRESGLIHQRLSICEAYYGLNGPPPYECVRETIPVRTGWKTVSRLVPE
jgi:hypothetical protein